MHPALEAIVAADEEQRARIDHAAAEARARVEAARGERERRMCDSAAERERGVAEIVAQIQAATAAELAAREIRRKTSVEEHLATARLRVAEAAGTFASIVRDGPGGAS